MATVVAALLAFIVGGSGIITLKLELFHFFEILTLPRAITLTAAGGFWIMLSIGLGVTTSIYICVKNGASIERGESSNHVIFTPTPKARSFKEYSSLTKEAQKECKNSQQCSFIIFKNTQNTDWQIFNEEMIHIPPGQFFIYYISPPISPQGKPIIVIQHYETMERAIEHAKALHCKEFTFSPTNTLTFNALYYKS